MVRGRDQVREAEALSLKEALTWMKTWRTSKCIFETNAKLLADVIYGGRGMSIFYIIVKDCIELMKHFVEVLVVFNRRSANIVAHLVVHAAYFMLGLRKWYHTDPDFISCNLISEEV